MFKKGLYCIAGIAAVLVTPPAQSQSLKGSPSSLDRQNYAAERHDYTYLNNRTHVLRFVDQGNLIPLRGNADYEIARVSFPYARPAVRTFVERLARQYRSACGEKLVVTSLTRPRDSQPANASERSVHPTGMAVDLRVSHNPRCQRWLERTLLDLEAQRVIEATRERRPPHYHIAVFPTPYLNYVGVEKAQPKKAQRTTKLADASESREKSAPSKKAEPKKNESKEQTDVVHKIRSGESLWTISRKYGVSVEELMKTNRLKTSRVKAGRTLKIPADAKKRP